jgi:hypothetical protein
MSGESLVGDGGDLGDGVRAGVGVGLHSDQVAVDLDDRVAGPDVCGVLGGVEAGGVVGVRCLTRTRPAAVLRSGRVAASMLA